MGSPFVNARTAYHFISPAEGRLSAQELGPQNVLAVAHSRNRAGRAPRRYIAPFVGLIRQRIDYVLHEAEVTEVFEVPLDALIDVSQPEVRYVKFRDNEYPAYFYRYRDYEIWGLTGRMLKAFLDLVWQAV